MIGTIRWVVLGAALAALGGSAPSPGSFGVGVLRRDGVLLPFATFDGRHWRNTWPPPQQELTVPTSLDRVPKNWWGPTGPLETWHAWIDGSERPVHVKQPDWVGVHCARHLALLTDYKYDGVVPPEQEQPYPKEGVAVSPAQPVERIDVLLPTALELNALGPVLREAFNRAERETASRSNHPLNRGAREVVEPAIEAAYAFGDSPRIYYIEAIRAYRALGQRPDECIATAFGTGWFVREGDKVRSLLMFVDLLRCNRFGASYMLPLGVVRSADRLFWIAQFSGWDHERYAVVEITSKKVEVMVSTWGGGC